MIKDNLPVVILAVAILGVGVLGLNQEAPQVTVMSDGETRVVESSVGAFAGPDVYQHVELHEGVTYGGSCFATSTTGTLTDAMLSSSCIYITSAGAGQAVLSLTLPATSTNLVSDAGQCRDWFVDASDVASGTTTTFVAGTGVDLVGLDATGAGTGADVMDGGEYGRLTMCRQTDGGITAYVQEYINAD